jgi:hypothetical protein
MQYRVLRYTIFVTGLLLAGLSFLLCFGNALTGEGRSESVENAALIGMGVGSVLSAAAIIAGAAMARRFLPLAASVMGGLAAGIGGYSLWSLNGGTSIFEWMLAGFFAPIGMWLGWLGGASRSQAVVGATVGGAVGAVVAGIAFRVLFNMDDPIHDGGNALFGLIVGGVCGIVPGAVLGWAFPPRAGADG